MIKIRTKLCITGSISSARKLLLMIPALLFVKQAFCQEPMNLTMDQAVSYAIDNNKTVKNAKYRIDKSQQAIWENIALGLPQVNATVNYNNYLGANASLQMSPEVPPAVIEFNPTSNLQATVSQLLFSGNYFIGINLMKIAKSISEENYKKTELDIKEQTINTYCSILATTRIMNILKKNKENAQLIYEKTLNMSKAGMVEETDAKKLSVMVAMVDNELKSSERNVEISYNMLRYCLGLPANQEIVLTSTLEEVAEKYVIHSVADQPFAIDNNIDYQLMSKNTEMSGKMVTLKQSNYLPTLSAFYSRTEKLLQPLFDMTPKNVLGLTLNIPIVSGGQRNAQVSQARLEKKISDNNQSLLADQLILQERQVQYTYSKMREQYNVQKNNIAVAKEILDNMNLKYTQGMVSSIELTTANTDYLNAESTYTGIILQMLNAEITLRKMNNKL